MTICLDVTDKLEAGLVEVYGKIHSLAVSLDIPLLIVGATARDIILVHGFHAQIERGTRDVDFAIEVKNWAHYETLRHALVEHGFTQHEQETQKLTINDSDNKPWEIDLIPFGGVSDTDGQITWPPEHAIVMSVLGFEEVYAHAWDVTLSQTPALTVRVASPAGILLLKLIAWTERRLSVPGKDATDLYYVIRHYSKIPSVINALYDDGYMEANDYDDIQASAMKLADEVLIMSHPATLSHLYAMLFNDEYKLEKLTTDISKYTRAEYDEAEALVAIIKKQFLEENS